jgi:hypothetical protein
VEFDSYKGNHGEFPATVYSRDMVTWSKWSNVENLKRIKTEPARQEKSP